MKIEKRDGSRERKILIALITDQIVLARISAKWERDLFSSKWANLIGQWAVDYFKRYSKPPAKDIQGIYEQWATTNQDEDTGKLVEKFLQILSEEAETSEEQNSAVIIDLAGEHFRGVKLRKLSEAISSSLDTGKVEEADGWVTQYHKIELGVGVGVNLLLEDEAIKSTFLKRESQELVAYPGDLEFFFHNTLERDSFVVFAGTQKSGKTYWLVDVAWRAMLQRRKVAFFEIGDLSEQQLKERFLIRAAKNPIRSPEKKWPFSIRYPTEISLPPKEGDKPIASVKFRDKVFEKPLDYPMAKLACERVMRMQVKSKESHFRFSVHPNLSISIQGIRSILESWSQQDFTPDVVVIDYSDNLAPVDKREEGRDRVNTTWKLMRALSQELHCLLVTATQCNAASFNKHTLDRSNFSEDNRKLSHVTAMCGINVSGPEKELGICRLNWIVRREGDYSVRRCCHVAGALAIANPAIVSAY